MIAWSILLMLTPVAQASDKAAGLGWDLPFVSVVPFVGLLLSIATFPLLVPHFWERTRNQLLVASIWAAPTLFHFGTIAVAGPHADEASAHLQHAAGEYVSFMALIGSLFVIAGGIHLSGDLRATPLVNTAFLAVGALLANLIGTTGASMLLIRPLLATNSERANVRHIPIFFIFLVANIGGALTPIGDPPLFLGYLRGVPFMWPLVHLWKPWLVSVSILVALFFVVDVYCYRREDAAHRTLDQERIVPLRLRGGWNFLLLLLVVVAVVAFSPQPGARDLHIREMALAVLAGSSLLLTSKDVRTENRFSFGPLQEVGALFAGIFVTMIPATLLLETRGATLGLTEPWQYFWASGALSSFLDNAPTYVTFAALACSQVSECIDAEHLEGLALSAEGLPLLVAVSVGSVFMGACTYIGNGPNFMVRAIARENGVAMPTFLGFMGWSLVCLVPVFLLVTFLFFRT